MPRRLERHATNLMNYTGAMNRSHLSELLQSGAPLVIDGALATYLETLGADISGALWSADILLKNPSLIKQTHLDYYRAGANIAITASYQASVDGLQKHLGLNVDDAKALIRKSVELAIQAQKECEQDSSNKFFVAGSVGPYGAFLANGSEYRGDYVLSTEDMKDFHRGRIEALVEAGVDILACETIPSKAETEALLELITTEFPQSLAFFAFTLRDTEHISDGTPLAEIAALFSSTKQIVALGVNCVADDLVLGALNTLEPLKKHMTLIVYPNSGETWNAGAREWEGSRTEGSSLAEKTNEWWNAGATMIGGCCRTTPDDIKVITKTLADKIN